MDSGNLQLSSTCSRNRVPSCLRKVLYKKSNYFLSLSLRSDAIAFEKAYCEYRLNRVENALKTIESANEQTDKLKELYGQVVNPYPFFKSGLVR